MSECINQYLRNIETALKAGNATEHTHRPALKILLEALDEQVTATNEPKRIACGAPDYILTRDGLTIGYVEAKDVGNPLSETERSEQLKRYRRALDNLILTDYLTFRWYVDGELRIEARLAEVQSDGKLKAERNSKQAVEELLTSFLNHQSQEINTPKDLAERMARLTHIIRDIIITAFETEQASGLLIGWRDAFARVLIADLNQPEHTADFADMFAQTLAYGLFTARIMDESPAHFTRQEAQYLIPKSNPFLRDFFIQITGPQLDDEPYASFVNDLVTLLAHTDMSAVLADFGRRTRQEDPVVHFYETFLAAYDPKLRESRGVYYTPEPVVSYIVRSVDHILKTHFDCPDGLADSSKITIPNPDPGLTVKGKAQPRKTTESHKVLVLDPATGTGTFLYAVIDHIRQQFIQQGNAGMWPGYVKNHLLPRLFGFELLMAPYAVAHFKLSLQLAGRDLPEALADQYAYHPAEGERLGVYLTNALEEPHEMTGLPLFTQWVADETNAANEVKSRLPVLVVMGNPPYSISSSNKGEWIENLMDTYKQAVRCERNIQPLSDDYIKFIRLAQERIEHTEQGIISIITNHAYLSGLLHRGMREELIKAFDEIYILDLHGNALTGLTTPEGELDQNVFDIRQGVAIALFVKSSKNKGPAIINHAELWGNRESKYDYLFEYDINSTKWQKLAPSSPYYFFVPKDFNLQNEYDEMHSISMVFPLDSTGFATHRDSFAINFSSSELKEKITKFRNPNYSNEEIKKLYELQDTRDWQLSLARKSLQKDDNWQNYFTYCLYRPFDIRNIFYSSNVVEYPRLPVMQHFQNQNIGLISCRMIKGEDPNHFYVTKKPTEKISLSSKTSNNAFIFPLYLYPTEDSTNQTSLLDTAPWPPDAAHGGRTPNLNPAFVKDMAARLGLTFTPHAAGDLQTTFGPEDIFHYIYAVFHSPTYRIRYAEFLKIDFPRVPLTSDVALFRSLCALGQELVQLHLLESPQVRQPITRYPVTGENRVEKGYPRYTAPQDDQPGRVYINGSQYVEGVPEDVWEFMVGGYQVLDKWLKDRRGRQLSYDDLNHYQQVVVALQRTIEVMDEIDEAIPDWPIK